MKGTSPEEKPMTVQKPSYRSRTGIKLMQRLPNLIDEANAVRSEQSRALISKKAIDLALETHPVTLTLPKTK
jgi:hypothetical protein